MLRSKKRKKLEYLAARSGAPLPTREVNVNPAELRALVDSSRLPVGPRAVPATGRHWYSTGPNNLGGRIRCLAIDPGDDLVVYAASASGGVFKTEDGGEVWAPMPMPNEESISIASLAIAPSQHDVVYAATGEPPFGLFPGAGIYRSVGGAAFTHIATAEQLNGSFELETIAVHPHLPGNVWVVGKRGVFRTTTGLAAAPVWERFADEPAGELPIFYSDVAFADAGAPAARVFLVRGRTGRGEIVRIDDPTAGSAAIVADLQRAGNRKRVFGADGVAPAEPVTMRGKIAIAPSDQDTAYVAFVQFEQDHVNNEANVNLRGILRTTDARGGGTNNFTATTWTAITAPVGPGGAGDWNLTLGVSRANAGHVFFGMVNLFYCTNGRTGPPTWHLAMPTGALRIDQSHHADHHFVAFEAGAGSPVWHAHDGGVSRSTNYATATEFHLERADGVDTRRSDLRANAIRWQRRIHGLVAAQAYDLTQSPLVPTMYGSGHQDNGMWFTAGGDTWRRAFTADGGYIAWDPLDPYRFYATWQGAIDLVTFSGGWDAAVPPADLDMTTFLWPRELNQGFHRLDGSRFVADTVHHPRTPGRLVTTRDRRAYATRDGERFSALPFGDIVELIAKHEFPQPGTPDTARLFIDGMIMLEIVGGTAGPALGFYRSVHFDTSNLTQNPPRIETPPNPTGPTRAMGTNFCTMRCFRRAPYALSDGMTLQLRARCRDRGPGTGPGNEVDVPLPTITFNTGHFVDITRATADEVARVITAALPPVTIGARRVTVESKATFHSAPLNVVVLTDAVGPATRLQFGGTPSLLVGLGLHTSPINGADGRPAMMTLQTLRVDNPRFPPGDLDVSTAVGETLTIDVNGTGPVTLTVTAHMFADPTAIKAEELAIAINDVLGRASKPARAEATTLTQEVVVFRADAAVTTGAPDVAASTALAPMTEGNVPRGRARAFDAFEPELVFVPHQRGNAFQLAPIGVTPRRLRLTSQIGAATTNVDIDFDAAGIGDRSRATVDEVAAKIRASIPAARRLRCEVRDRVGSGSPSELAYSSDDPAHLWVGTEDGQIWKSTDDGNSWQQVGDPRMKRLGRPVEAIAVDPRDSNVVYVGLGSRLSGDDDPGTLWKTTTGGAPPAIGEAWTALGRIALPLGDFVALAEVDGTGAPVSPRRLLGISEIVIDPERDPPPPDPRSPTRIWVATSAGVFESRDGGSNFTAFSEGLPNAPVEDLALVPGPRRMLRCTLHGRGSFARDIGTRPTEATPDTQLYVRNSLLDDGALRPADDGLDGFSSFPRQITRWESPDIKVSRLPYSDLGAAPQISAQDFDEDIVSEPITQRSGAGQDPHTIFVLVHNRSERAPSGDTRVIALWADCTDGVPRLPSDLYTTINAGGGPTVTGPSWSLAGTATITNPRGPTAYRPRAVSIAFTPPADVGVAFHSIGILVLVDTPDARFTSATFSVRDLLATERRAGFRLVPTRSARESEQLILRALDGVPFTVTEPAPVPLGLVVGAPGVTEQRGATLAAPVDISAGAARTMTVTTVPVAPATAVSVTVTFAPAELTALGLAPAAMTVPAFRRFINRALRAGGLNIRAVTERAELSVRADDHTADLVAAAAAFAAPEIDNAAAAIASGDFLTLGTLKRSATNSIYARIRNRGGATEPLLTWRAYSFDPAAATIELDAANLIATATIANLAPGASQVVAMTHDPGAAAGSTHRGVLIWASSPGDPLPAPAPSAEPPPPGSRFDGLTALDAACARGPNIAYRLLPLVT